MRVCDTFLWLILVVQSTDYPGNEIKCDALSFKGKMNVSGGGDKATNV